MLYPLPPYQTCGPLVPRRRCCCPSSWARIRSRKPISEMSPLIGMHDVVWLSSRSCTCVLRAWLWARSSALGCRKSQCEMRGCCCRQLGWARYVKYWGPSKETWSSPRVPASTGTRSACSMRAMRAGSVRVSLAVHAA